MRFEGDISLNANPAEVKACLKSSKCLKACLPNCLSTERLDKQTILATLKSSIVPDLELTFIFTVTEQRDAKPSLTIFWKSAEKQYIMHNGKSELRLTGEGDHTRMHYATTLDAVPTNDDIEGYPDVVEDVFTGYFRNLVEFFKDRGSTTMSNGKTGKPKSTNIPDFDEVLAEAENPAIELEHEAEEAAARGFLGGPQMWGIVALAAFLLLLLIFFR